MKYKNGYKVCVGGFCFISMISVPIVGSRILGIGLPSVVKKSLVTADILILFFMIFYTIKSNELYKKKVVILAPEKSRLELLKSYAEYDVNRKENSYSYEFQLGRKAPKILDQYNYSEYLLNVEPMTDMVVFKLLDFVCDHFGHDGNKKLGYGRRMTDIISLCEKQNGKTNCRGLSIILASLLRINGIKARHVTCKPYEEPFTDCHVVVDCLLPSGKRIMLDPTWRVYLRDQNGEYVSLEHFRKGLIEGQNFYENQEASYNGSHFDKKFYFEYMSKNMLRFSSNLYCADVKDEAKLYEVELVPKNYPVSEFHDKDRFVFNPRNFWNI